LFDFLAAHQAMMAVKADEAVATAESMVADFDGLRAACCGQGVVAYKSLTLTGAGHTVSSQPL
jgi:hypothetical protein